LRFLDESTENVYRIAKLGDVENAILAAIPDPDLSNALANYGMGFQSTGFNPL